jgi:biopolymer transport protein ExbB/TolQ
MQRIVLLLLATGAIAWCADGPVVLDLAQITNTITADQMSAVAGTLLTKTITDLADAKTISLADEHNFIAAVEEYDYAHKNNLENSEKLFDVLLARHKDEPEALLEILYSQAFLYRNFMPNKEKLAKVIHNICEE